MKRKQIMPTSSAMIITNCSPSKVVGSPKKRKASRSITKVENYKSTEEQAKEIQSSLDPTCPSFIKLMLRSHVSGCFWLGLPSKFCLSSLPKNDTLFTLVDEDGEEYTANYLPRKWGLSGGWRAFSIAHKLVAGDALVFHLVKVSIFKVYIVRTHTLAEVDAALDILTLESNTEGSETGGKDMKKSKKRAQKLVHFRSPVVLSEDQNVKLPLAGSDQPEDHTSEEVIDSEVPEGIQHLGSVVESREIKNFESFVISVNNLTIDSEIPEHVRAKYYELCRSQNTFLHENLMVGLNPKLVAGMISEIVNLADAVRASKHSTRREEFEAWENSLKAFKQLGMNVAFLLSRLSKLLKLLSESEEAFDLKRYNEAMNGKNRVKGETTTLEMQILELKNDSTRLDTEIKTLKLQAEKHESTFKSEVSYPW
ncbi:B3 domain-containing protein Os01g0234100-like isoform X1 [Papaver somniferum]|uniref:B3 domain-containing protein Os01g0234100-like isoform X1 n=2 Tax=Papaver somniferum TaxID=3469 RepID=UPI000E6F79E7|nr:B3 domain-containing protein Os01g0234100-like isoform X1 [Papaver somniferum]